MAAAGPTTLWAVAAAGVEIACTISLGCGRVELQLVQGGDVLVREVYPDRSTAYERARELRADLERKDDG